MPTGIRKDIHLEKILKEMQRLELAWRSFALPDARVAFLMSPILGALRAEGVPVPTFQVTKALPAHTLGLFVYSDWRIDVNEQCAISQTTLTNDDLKNMIATLGPVLAHEARHCEQFWRMTKRMCDRIKDKGLKVSLATLQNMLPGMPDHILRKALPQIPFAQLPAWPPKAPPRPPPPRRNPPGQNPQPLRRAPLSPAEQEAETWYESIYGRGSSSRAFVLTAPELIPAPAPTFPSRQQGSRFEVGRSYGETTQARYQRFPEEEDAWDFQIELEKRYLAGTGIGIPLDFARSGASGGVSSY